MAHGDKVIVLLIAKGEYTENFGCFEIFFGCKNINPPYTHCFACICTSGAVHKVRRAIFGQF